MHRAERIDRQDACTETANRRSEKEDAHNRRSPNTEAEQRHRGELVKYCRINQPIAHDFQETRLTRNGKDERLEEQSYKYDADID